MQELGQLLLLVTFVVTLATALAAVAGALTRHAGLIRSTRYGVYAATLLYVAMAIILTHSFLTHDFTNKYVSTYSDRTMPTLYLIAAFWGGEKGALLFWTTSLTIFSAISIYANRDRAPVYMAWVTAILMGAVFFFDILMVFESSPFETFLTSAGPRDGKGLNPLLQNATMVFHPPSLLTGYITFTIPFAYAAAAMITGKLDDQWITDTRKWTILSWTFLSIGLLLGCLWAYEELGWGFYWMWDPVENAGFIPWLTATAFLHSVMIQERRGLLKRWNVVLVCLTFLLTIFGTFLTRSQLIDSIHAFADSSLAEYFLWYMAVIAVASVVMIARRWKELAPEGSIDSFSSRESAFVLNNFVLVGSAFVVIWGTLFPKVSESPTVRELHNSLAGMWNHTVGGALGDIQPLDQAVNLGEPWFNMVMAPIGLLLLFLMGVGPLVSWRRATVSNFRKNFVAPLAGSLVVTVVGTATAVLVRIDEIAGLYDLDFGAAYRNWASGLGLDAVYVFLAYLLAVFVAWTIGREFHRGAKIRARKFAGGYLGNMIALTFKNPRRYGGYVIHFAVVLMIIAFTGKVFKVQNPERLLNLGDSMAVDDYNVTFASMQQAWNDQGGYAMTRATISVLQRGQTVAAREVDELATWLQERYRTPFHVETRLDSPKVQVRFADEATRERIREDFYLARQFAGDFELLMENEAARKMTWRVRDGGLLKVVPMLAMQKIRAAKAFFQEADALGARAAGRPGSPDLDLTFADDASYAGFKARLADATFPESVIYGRYNSEAGVLELIDARTGTHRYPEVRFYAKHQSPTTETAIASSFLEDLYVAMRPQMGQPFINLLTVVFPLVTFLWLGGILLIFGALIAVTPRWLTRTIISMTRSGTAAAALLGLGAGALALALVALPAPPASASTRTMTEPAEYPPPEGDPLQHLLGSLGCRCIEQGDDVLRNDDLSDASCDCPQAAQDRALVSELFGRTRTADRASGKAAVEVMFTLMDMDPNWESRLRYSREGFEHLLSTTKTTCPGERGLVLAQAQIGCSVRNKWLPIFRVMLTAGFPEEQIFRFYVDEEDATRGENWTYADLRADPDRPMSWAVPGAIVAILLVLFLIGVRRKMRRGKAAAAGEAPGEAAAPGREVAGHVAPALSARDRLRLEDELDAWEI